MAKPTDLKGMKGINDLKRALKNLPVTTVAAIAAKAAPAMTEFAQGSFNSGQTVHDKPRPLGVDGDELTLRKSGALQRQIEFRATGRSIRTLPLKKYMGVAIGKYGVLPNRKVLPQKWKAKLAEIAGAEIAARVKPKP